MTTKRYALYCECQEVLKDNEVMLLFSSNDKLHLRKSNSPIAISVDYFMVESDLSKVTSQYNAHYFFDPKSVKMKLSISPQDFWKVIGVYLHSVTNHLEI
jgi:hypothetical protein